MASNSTNNREILVNGGQTLMYYKIKVNKNNLEVVSQVEKIRNDEFLYLTQDEIDRISPDALIGYNSNENEIIS